MAQAKVDRIIAVVDREIAPSEATAPEAIDILERVVEELQTRIEALKEDVEE